MRSSIFFATLVLCSGHILYAQNRIIGEMYSYDGAGRLIQVAYSNGAGIEYTYDRSGNVVQLASMAKTTRVESPPPFLNTTLLQSTPNPFSAFTDIGFVLTTRTPVEVTILDILGRRIASIDHGICEPGEHHVRWNGRSDHGHLVRPGIYHYQLRAGDVLLAGTCIKME